MKVLRLFIISAILLNSCTNKEINSDKNTSENKKQELLTKISEFEKKGMNTSEGINQAD